MLLDCEVLVTVAAFVKGIADGEVRPCAVLQNPGLGGFLFTKSGLFEYAAAQPHLE